MAFFMLNDCLLLGFTDARETLDFYTNDENDISKVFIAGRRYIELGSFGSHIDFEGPFRAVIRAQSCASFLFYISLLARKYRLHNHTL